MMRNYLAAYIDDVWRIGRSLNRRNVRGHDVRVRGGGGGGGGEDVGTELIYVMRKGSRVTTGSFVWYEVMYR